MKPYKGQIKAICMVNLTKFLDMVKFGRSGHLSVLNKYTKCHQNSRGQPSFHVDFTWNGPIGIPSYNHRLHTPPGIGVCVII